MEQATLERGPLLTDEEWAEYQELMQKRRDMMAVINDEIADLDLLLDSGVNPKKPYE